jgi:prepilin-type N-terminal cleavage/methylation domain-containing protein
MQTTSPAIGSKQPARRGNRRGFTLIELLIVTVIIGMLVAMIAPALMGAFSTARDAGVITEIKQLESAVTAFKTVYGVEPPSRVIIYESPAGWTGDTESRSAIRRIWPQYDFTTAHHATNFPRDLTGDGDADDEIRLNAGEALVFFLGGVVNRTTGAAEGFAKNPARPFLPASAAASREGPFFEFDPARFVDLDSNFTTGSGAGNTEWGWREYRDNLPAQTKPYLYFSSREGRGYQTLTTPIDGTFVDVYRVFNPTSSTATPNAPGVGATLSSAYPAHKPQTFQIISPGVDGFYGKGGVFNPAKPLSWLADVGDYDNLTNFHGGRLKR